MGFFAPIFFASAGLNVNLTSLLQPKLAFITILLTVIAVADQVGGMLCCRSAEWIGAMGVTFSGSGRQYKRFNGTYSLHARIFAQHHQRRHVCDRDFHFTWRHHGLAF